MTPRWSLVATFAALLLLVAPATSSASSRGSEPRLELDAGNGYRFVVFGEGSGVLVEVGRPRSLEPLPETHLGSQSLTAYAARGTATGHRIFASFAQFGRIDVRFRPIGKAVVLPTKKHCVEHFARQEGVFVGSIRFEGEHRYIALRAHRARGVVFRPLSLHCPPTHARASVSERGRPVAPIGSGHFRRVLLASWRQAVASTRLYAEVDHGRVFTSAAVEESLGPVAEYHFGLAISRPRVFAVDNALTRATLVPPPPFHGEGTYEAGPDGSESWTGSLSVSFPGVPRWPLTGKQFKVSLGGGL